MSATNCDQLSREEHIMLCIDILEGRKEIVGTYPGEDYNVCDSESNDLTPGIFSVFESLVKENEEIHKLLNKATNKLLFISESLSSTEISKLNLKWKHEIHTDDDDRCVFPEFSEPDDLSSIGDKDQEISNFLKAVQSNVGDDYEWLSPRGEFYLVKWGNIKNLQLIT